MGSKNGAHFIGRLGKDAEMRYTPKATAMVTFNVAVDIPAFGDNKDNKKTLWVSCVMYGTRAEKVSPFLLKGTQIAVEGRIEPYEYTNTDGVAKSGWNLVVEDVGLLGKAQGAGEKTSKPAEQEEYPTVAADEAYSVPF
jgi:single-strand DNA-binding protein